MSTEVGVCSCYLEDQRIRECSAVVPYCLSGFIQKREPPKEMAERKKRSIGTAIASIAANDEVGKQVNRRVTDF